MATLPTLDELLRLGILQGVQDGTISLAPAPAEGGIVIPTMDRNLDMPRCQLQQGEHGGAVEWMVRDYSPNNGPLRAPMCAKHRAHTDCAAYGWRLERNEGVLRRYRVVIK